MSDYSPSGELLGPAENVLREKIYVSNFRKAKREFEDYMYDRRAVELGFYGPLSTAFLFFILLFIGTLVLVLVKYKGDLGESFALIIFFSVLFLLPAIVLGRVHKKKMREKGFVLHGVRWMTLKEKEATENYGRLSGFFHPFFILLFIPTLVIGLISGLAGDLWESFALIFFSVLFLLSAIVLGRVHKKKMREKGFVPHGVRWMTLKEKEATEKISEFDRIWYATKDSRVASMKGEAMKAIDEKDFQMVHKLLEKAREVATEKINKVVKAIEEFEPERKYDREDLYQVDLRRFLHSEFPSAKTEEAKGSSRPDIVIDEIAIEVKGPTYTSDLETIADKVLRYTQHYDHLIVVLFDINATESRFEEWKKGMKKMERIFPTVRIIEK